MCEPMLRPCRASDLDAIVPLLQQLWPETELDRGKLSVVFARGLSSDDQHFFCADRAGAILAFCSLSFRNSIKRQGPLAFIEELVVDESMRGQGLGGRMLDHAIAMARERGCPVIELESGSHREEAHRFYLERGFEHRALYFSRPLA